MRKKVRVVKHNPQCSSIVPVVIDGDEYCDCHPSVKYIGKKKALADIFKAIGKKNRESRS